MTFITLEGMEGSGKSTQAQRLGEALGSEAIVTREPGGTALGRGIRSLLLDRRQQRMCGETEVLLYFADRAQHVAEVLRPAVAAGRLVVCDRYVDSSLAYQGYGRGLSLELLGGVARLATGDLRPDLTLFLDVPLEAGLARVQERGGYDRLEAEPLAFHRRVREGYSALMAAEPRRWVVVDALGAPAEVTARLLQVIEARGFSRAHGAR